MQSSKKKHQHIQQYIPGIVTIYIPLITIVSTIYSAYWNYLNGYFLSFNYINYMSTRDFIYDIINFLPVTISSVLIIYIYTLVVDLKFPLKMNSMRYSTPEDLVRDPSYRWRFVFIMFPSISAALIFGIIISDTLIESKSGRATFILIMFSIYLLLLLLFIHSNTLGRIVYSRYGDMILIKRYSAFVVSSFIFSLSFICLHAYVNSIVLVGMNEKRLDQIIHYKSNNHIDDVTVKVLDIGVVVYRKSQNHLFLQKWDNIDYIESNNSPISSINKRSLDDFIDIYIPYFGINKPYQQNP